MRITKMEMLKALGALTVLFVIASCGAESQPTPPSDPPAEATPEPLADPVPEKIAFGNVTVRAEPFVQLPQTEDANPNVPNPPYARIQYLVPVPDGSGRLAVNDLRGQLYWVDAGGKAASLYLDHGQADIGFDASEFVREMGFTSVAFHPHFAHADKPGHGKFYTAHSAPSESGVADYFDDDSQSHESVVREWTTNDTAANTFSGTSREVLRVGQFASNNNIANIAFNPTVKEGAPDFGMLYVALGDGGAAGDPRENAQSLRSPLGAILRIDPLGGDDARGYGVPDDNPFVGGQDAAPEIWVYGMRHPQHFSWDADGRMFFIDIGQDQIEEVNLAIPGANYGWRLREGAFATAYAYEDARIGPVYPRPERDATPFVDPIAQYDHDEGNAVGSGFVYRGAAIPALRGKFVFTDFVRGRLFAIDANDVEPGKMQTILELRLELPNGQTLLDAAGYPNSFNPGTRRVDARLGMDATGELYLLTKGDGWVRRLVAGG